MNKDVIYIDTEDDITAIIGKVKAAESKIVALVPPKRVGVLQSAVNLKLLQKAALSADKRAVLITNDHSLTALAAGIKMPVAKNLQSRPEIPNMAMPETPEEEVINGQDLPVGDVAQSLGSDASANEQNAAETISKKVDITDASQQKAQPKKLDQIAKANKKNKLTIPNFEVFRKRIFIFGALGVLLISFLVWAFVFAPSATVTISAKTTNVNIERTLSLRPGTDKSDTGAFILKPNVQQIKKSVATEFPATGTKEIGNEATGQVSVTNCEYTQGFTINSGTIFTAANGKQFKSTQTVAMPGYAQQSKCSDTTKEVPVQATAFGPEYNISAQSYSIAGVSGNVTAGGTEMTGGTKEQVAVVSQEDVEKAKSQLGAQNADEVKTELKKQFNANETIVIEESFMAEQAAPSVAPKVGERAQNAKLTVETTYTYIGIAREDVRTILTNAINDALKDKPEQQMYSLGENSIVFQTFEKADGGNYTARMVTTGAIGPKINSKELAQQLVGKRYGEIQAIVNQIPGVDRVDISFSPFWVTTAPGADKINIKFSVAPNSR